MNYRLNITFKNGDTKYSVPAFYSSDGNAAESIAVKGKVWKLRFRPDKIGKWDYEVPFRKVKNIAINESNDYGEPVSFDGTKGSFVISDTNEKIDVHYAKGRIANADGTYLKYTETQEPF